MRYIVRGETSIVLSIRIFERLFLGHFKRCSSSGWSRANSARRGGRWSPNRGCISGRPLLDRPRRVRYNHDLHSRHVQIRRS